MVRSLQVASFFFLCSKLILPFNLNLSRLHYYFPSPRVEMNETRLGIIHEVLSKALL